MGKWVFVADEDTLEQAALRAAANRGWNLVMVESGLGGALTRRLANSGAGNLLQVEHAELEQGQLRDYLDTIREGQGAHAALGLAAFPQHKKVELALITPETTNDRTASFGGHPGLLARWAVNIALNWLRRSAEGDN